VTPRVTRISLAAMFVLGGQLVHAQAPPERQLVPNRDVIVTYHLSGPEFELGPTNLRIAYADNNQRVRLDFFALSQIETSYGSIIFDGPANKVLSLFPAQHFYYTVPAAGRANPGILLTEKMNYVFKNTATYLGMSCTEWEVTNGPEFAGTVCLTSDGVALHMNRTVPKVGEMEAVEVVYQTPAEDTFKPSPDLILRPSK
jgi:hypothetical protein